jgi:RHS repeat-associated protein
VAQRRWDTNTVTAYLPASASYTYDLNGNLLSDGRRNFAYDDENQLISVWVANGWSNSFAYDGLLRKRIEKDYTWNGSGWQLTNEVHYVYDGNVVIQERDQNNLPVVTYTRGVDLSGSLQGAGGIGGLLARTDMDRLTVNDPLASAYYHADGNGNITALVTDLMDTNQVLVAKYLYDSYWNLLAESGPLAGGNKYRFSSKEWDSRAGLYYYLYRFYDPNLQRWLNRDPLGELGFETLHLADQPLSIRKLLLGIYDPQMSKMSSRGSLNSEGIAGPNLYEMTGNDRVNYMDPDGRGVWGGFKNGVLSPIGHFLGNNWGKLSAAVSTVCLVGPAYNCAQLWKAAANAADAYRNEVNQLNAKYGDPGDWPPDIQQLMSQWQSSIIQEAGQAAAACGGVGGTSITGGPIGGPEHPF